MLDAQLPEQTPEFELLLAILRSPTDEQHAEHLRLRMNERLDWKHFVNIAFRHKVIPQLYGTLGPESKALLPPDTRETLNNLYLRNAKKAMIRSAETVSILRRFQAHDINSLALKGPPLSLWAYGDISLRYAGDLDLFVAEHQADLAESLISESGYDNITPGLRHRTQLRQLTANTEFRSDRLDLTLELHWRLTHHKLMTTEFNALYNRAQSTTITGFPIKVLSPEDRFVYLIVHGSNHGWFRLAWLCDIGQIIQRHQDLDWSHIYHEANKMDLDRVMRQAMTLVDRLLNVSIPAPLAPPKGPSRMDMTLTQTALDAMQSPNPFLVNWDKLTWREIVNGTRYRLKLHRSLSYKAGVLRKMLIRPQDWDDFPLPGFLFPLYYILNPALMLIRIFTKSRL